MSFPRGRAGARTRAAARARPSLARLARPPRQPRPRVVWQRAHAAQRQLVALRQVHQDPLQRGGAHRGRDDLDVRAGEVGAAPCTRRASAATTRFTSSSPAPTTIRRACPARPRCGCPRRPRASRPFPYLQSEEECAQARSSDAERDAAEFADLLDALGACGFEADVVDGAGCRAAASFRPGAMRFDGRARRRRPGSGGGAAGVASLEAASSLLGIGSEELHEHMLHLSSGRTRRSCPSASSRRQTRDADRQGDLSARQPDRRDDQRGAQDEGAASNSEGARRRRGGGVGRASSTGTASRRLRGQLFISSASTSPTPARQQHFIVHTFEQEQGLDLARRASNGRRSPTRTTATPRCAGTPSPPRAGRRVPPPKPSDALPTAHLRRAARQVAPAAAPERRLPPRGLRAPRATRPLSWSTARRAARTPSRGLSTRTPTPSPSTQELALAHGQPTQGVRDFAAAAERRSRQASTRRPPRERRRPP